MTQPERGTGDRAGEVEEHRWVEIKKFSLGPEKYDGKVDFEGWVNQFEEYAIFGQWSDEESPLPSLTGGARMYFVRLPEPENMTYQTRVEDLRSPFGQETNTRIALQDSGLLLQ